MSDTAPLRTERASASSKRSTVGHGVSFRRKSLRAPSLALWHEHGAGHRALADKETPVLDVLGQDQPGDAALRSAATAARLATGACTSGSTLATSASAPFGISAHGANVPAST